MDKENKYLSVKKISERGGSASSPHLSYSKSSTIGTFGKKDRQGYKGNDAGFARDEGRIETGYLGRGLRLVSCLLTQPEKHVIKWYAKK